MAVQQEIKSQLAKLLATEDIVVEHKQVESAQFNVRTRVLILPLWEKASNDVYDMLVGHEVGHALFTPDEDWWVDYEIPQDFVNVVEDARIEKLMKRKYMGLAKSFYKGYSELHDKDFFELDGQDINSLNLADRANLHFKLSSILPISFSAPEEEIISLIQNAETFTETLSAAEALYNFCKQESKKDSQENKQKAKLDFEQDLEDLGDLSDNSTVDNQSPLPDLDSSSSMEDRSDNASGDDWMDDTDSSLEVKTADSLDSKLRDLVNSGEHVKENIYVEIPKVKLNDIIVSNEEVHNYIDGDWIEQNKRWEESNIPMTIKFDEVDADYAKFKNDAKKEVSYLVKEFECRKSASAYARSNTSRTGVLDTKKLQTYRFNEDLFKRVTVLPDGKNHGLVFVLDWSGSMQYVLQDTLKQLYNLMWFCKKVQIPFEVYAFTMEWNGRSKYEEKLSVKYEEREGVLHIDEQFNLMNLFSSKTNAKTLEHQMINIWRIAQCFRASSLYTYPRRLSLSGTPLNEALVCLHQLIPQFKKDTGVEKVQCVVLTDGEAHQLPYRVNVKRHWEEEPYLGMRSCHPDRTFLRDRNVGKTYKVGYGYHDFTDMILTNLKDRFSSTNFIGIRVLQNRDAKSFMRLYHYKEYNRMAEEWRRAKAFTVKDSGYDAYFAMSANSLAEDAEFDVDDDATKAQIKRAFVKSLKTKKLNKKVLGEFISLVA